MKRSKLIMPVMALGFAVSLAFANKANVQSAGWINTEDGPEQLQNDPCNAPTNENCEVRFSDNLDMVYPVYTDSSLNTLKDGGTGTPYTIQR